MKNIITLFFLWTILSPLQSQIGIQTFEKGKFTYKQLLEKAKDKNALVLLILYSPEAPMTYIPEIREPDKILEEFNIVTDVADPFLEMLPLISSRLEIYNNPAWVLFHSNDIVIWLSSTIKNDNDLRTALQYGETFKKEYTESVLLLEKDKNDPQGLKKIITLLSNTQEKKEARKYINRFIKNQENWNNEDLLFITDITLACPCTSRQNEIISKHREKIVALTSEAKVKAVERQIMIGDLKRKSLYEPYMIWREFEKKFGSQADSLYRLEVINYHNTISLDKESLITELVDYIAFYPRTPWEALDPLFASLIKLVSETDDLILLKDLIEGQIFQEKNYKKLDYKAFILYRLGKKEESLVLLNEIRKLALSEGIDYKSMIHNLRKK